MCPKDKTPLSFRRICPKENREIQWDEVVRGYEVQKGKYIIITPKELEALELQSGRLVEVFQFVDADKLDAVYFDNSYYLIPDEHGEKPYYLMREALEQNNKVAVGRVVMHEKEHLIALRSYEGAILMTTLHYADEVRTPRDFPELKKPPEVEKEELELAGQLIKIMKKPFNFKEYRDRYQENLMKLVEAKMKGRRGHRAASSRDKADQESDGSPQGEHQSTRKTMTLFQERPLKPMMAKTGESFDSNDYVFEVKWDGLRA